ncbi:MAG TPA: radical SAM family heme chaperone HemW [Blastocatellia bacterium]|jgi:oxygen-independent coproporphyrinogen-3 oxidase
MYLILRYNSFVSKQAGLYIHIPFCARKCTYCNFNTTDFFEDAAENYIRALEMEIVRWGARLVEERSNKLSIDTIYLGGGTPSIVEAEQLSRIVDACRSAFDVSREAEITIEINPSTFSRQKIEGWLGAGINRASVGVQSFIDSELASLHRTHSSADAHLTVDALRERGFSNISLDLIAGLPHQTLRGWEFNLRQALRLRPEHLSLYLLEIKEGTQLYAEIKRRRQPRPDDDLAAEMYRMICDATRDEGYEHYEISNFARSGLRSQHNMKYWTDAPFYGLGSGAHSYDGRARWVNILRTESYIEAIARNGFAIAELRELSAEDRAAEALFMGLRLAEGIDLAAFRREFSVDVADRYSSELENLAEAGLIEMSDDRLKLTLEGMLLSNEVFVNFV